MTAWTPNSFITEPGFTHLTSLLTKAVSSSIKWFFSLKFFALAITVWMRNRKTRHYTAIVFSKFCSMFASLHIEWICLSVTWLQLWQKNWIASLHTLHFVFTSNSVPHLLHDSILIVYGMLFFNLNNMKIRWN